MNILIVEDDAFLAAKIAKTFQSRIAVNRVKTVSSYVEFLDELYCVGSYDLVLTDLKLFWDVRDLGGYRVIRAIREKDVRVPIIVMSGYGEIERLELAFEYGASDYLIKPIRLKELEVRIFNWLRNHYLSGMNFSWQTKCSYGGLIYDIGKNEFYFWDARIPLTKNSKYVLSIFLANRERSLSESFFSEKIWWDSDSDEIRNPRVNILRLKRALEPYGVDKWIRNIRGEWYRFSKG